MKKALIVLTVIALGITLGIMLSSCKKREAVAPPEPPNESRRAEETSPHPADESSIVKPWCKDVKYTLPGSTATTIYHSEVEAKDNDAITLILLMKDGRKIFIPFTAAYIEYSAVDKSCMGEKEQ